MGAPVNSMNRSCSPMVRCCEKVFTPVISPCCTKDGASIRYSMLCSPTVTASGSTADRPCSVRRCWKSTPFDTATQGSTRARSPEVCLADQLALFRAGNARHREPRRLPVECPDEPPRLRARIGPDPGARRDLVAGRNVHAAPRAVEAPVVIGAADLARRPPGPPTGRRPGVGRRRSAPGPCRVASRYRMTRVPRKSRPITCPLPSSLASASGNQD